MRCAALCLLLTGCDFVFFDGPRAGPAGAGDSGGFPADGGALADRRRAVQPPSGYVVTGLSGILPAPYDFTPVLRNACGQLVGQGIGFGLGSDSMSPILATPGTGAKYAVTDLGDAYMQQVSSVLAIQPAGLNQAGQVVGATTGRTPRAFFYDPRRGGKIIDLDALPIHPRYVSAGDAGGLTYTGLVPASACPGASSAAHDINDAAQIAGVADACVCRSGPFSCAVGPPVAMRWDMDPGGDGFFTLKGGLALGGATAGSAALAIASDGNVGGWVQDASGRPRPCMFTPQGRAILLPIAGFQSGQVLLMATLGAGGGSLAIGMVTDEGGAAGAVRWEDGGAPRPFSGAAAVKNRRPGTKDGTLLVGESGGAALWYFDGKDYQFQALGALLGAPPPVIGSALTIDDAGRILSYGNDNNPYLLTPVLALPRPACE